MATPSIRHILGVSLNLSATLEPEVQDSAVLSDRPSQVDD